MVDHSFIKDFENTNDILHTEYIFSKTRPKIAIDLMRLGQRCPNIEGENWPLVLLSNSKEILFCSNKRKEEIRQHMDIMLSEFKFFANYQH